ncbi:hypothetical protein HZU77_009775 [Neisseriaceae bacterium TC5R-5]|nr:hypothetical protein [Neisseriaceae bacterium TC5R-5]
MREIQSTAIGVELNTLLGVVNPIDEDIGILDENGKVLGVIITAEAYQCFLKKVEEEEDRLDAESVKQFQQNRR